MKKLFSFILLSAAMMMSGSAWATAPEPLTFTCNAAGSISATNNLSTFYVANPDIQYSINNGEWQSWDLKKISMSPGDVVKMRGTNPNGFGGILDARALSAEYGYPTFRKLIFNITSGSFSVSGDIMSLIDGEKIVDAVPSETYTITVFGNKLPAKPGAFYGMFNGCTGLTDASGLKLSATILADSCYVDMFKGCTGLTNAPTISATTSAPYCCYYMFQGCTSLTKAPELPATTAAYMCYKLMFSGCTSLTTAPEILPAAELAEECYNAMFNGCTSLTTAPELPATTLAPNCYQTMFFGCSSLVNVQEKLPATTMASYCYNAMFEGCTSLTTAPKLPATTLANFCYFYMFQNCSSLKTAPELPATVLTESCYNSMFNGCSSLVTAPVLPATTLAKLCYDAMFQNCTSLNYIKCLAPKIEKIESYYPTNNWLQGANPSGTRTFVKAAGATGWTNDVSGIPSGWTQETVSILDDSKEYDYSEFEGKSSLEMNRTFKHNGTNHTICLPFDLDEEAFASSPLGAGCTKLQTLGSAAIVDGTLEVTMVDVSTKAIEAGKPYLIAWENDGADVVCPTFEGVTFKEVAGGSIVKDDVTFHGLLGPQSVEVNDSSVLFVGATGNLNWPNAGSQINGYRCYFKVNTSSGSPIRRGMNAVLTEGKTTPTGIQAPSPSGEGWGEAQKLIEQGRVVIISDGVRYDLQGNILK